MSVSTISIQVYLCYRDANLQILFYNKTNKTHIFSTKTKKNVRKVQS